MSARASDAPEVQGGRPRTPLSVVLRTPVLHLTMIVVSLLIAVPIIFGILGGFKDNGQLGNNPIGLPNPWLISNYTELLTWTGGWLGFWHSSFWRPLLNSLLIALGTTFIVTSTAAMASFVLARFAFRGREALFMLFAVGLMFPFAVAILPLFVLLRTLGLLNNPLGVILPQAAFALPVTIIILRSFFRAIPREVEEAATLDGCGPFGFFWRVLLPMARPALWTVSVLALVTSWNTFFLPLLVFNDPSWWTLPVAVNQEFQTQYTDETGKVLAYVTIAMIPALAFYSIAERQLVGGLAGGTKG